MPAVLDNIRSLIGKKVGRGKEGRKGERKERGREGGDRGREREV